jgi:hypothetical protein
MSARLVFFVTALCAIAAPVLGGENGDLDFIPTPAAAEDVPPAASATTGRLFLESAATASSLRGDLPIPAPSASADWQERLSLDGAIQLPIGPQLTGILSDRLNFLAENDIAVPSRAEGRNDLREAYVSWEPVTQSYLDVGRINERDGVALGYNPTDFFRANTMVDLASIDPSVQREDRLGTVMVRGQTLFAGGSVRAVFAPKLQNAEPTTAVASLDPQIYRTNFTNRFLLTGSVDLSADVVPQVSAFVDDGHPRFGAALSRTLGEATVVYGEWAGGRQAGVIGAAHDLGVATGLLPAAFRDPQPGQSFANDLALGGSWTDASVLTLNLEYHYHQAGLDRQQWGQWFGRGSASSLYGGFFWYVRAFAAAQEDPLTRQQLFVRVDAQDTLARDLDVSALAFVDLYDGSTTFQVSAAYNFSGSWTLSALLSANAGAPRSDHGSLAQTGSAILLVTRYF